MDHKVSPLICPTSSTCLTDPSAFHGATNPGLRQIFSANLRMAAKQRQFGLNWVADQAGVSRTQLYNVLAARSSASLDWIGQIAAVFCIAPHNLLAPPHVLDVLP